MWKTELNKGHFRKRAGEGKIEGERAVVSGRSLVRDAFALIRSDPTWAVYLM